MSIIIALLVGGVIGAMLGTTWKAEEMHALQKANARLIIERDNAQSLFRTKQRQNWVS